MFERELEPFPVNLEGVDWQQAPYDRVFLSILDEEIDPADPTRPVFTLMALKIFPGGSIPVHRHVREDGWMETLTFPEGSQFTVLRDNGVKKVVAESRMTLTIIAGEAFGILNDSNRDLFFTSLMQPGFTGYEEIKAA